MSGQNIAMLAVLALLVALCFSSGVIARRVAPGDERRQQRVSLLIKLAAAAVALVLYLAVFLF